MEIADKKRLEGTTEVAHAFTRRSIFAGPIPCSFCFRISEIYHGECFYSKVIWTISGLVATRMGGPQVPAPEEV